MAGGLLEKVKQIINYFFLSILTFRILHLVTTFLTPSEIPIQHLYFCGRQYKIGLCGSFSLDLWLMLLTDLLLVYSKWSGAQDRSWVITQR